MPEVTIKTLSSLSPEELSAAEVAIVANPDPQDLLQLPRLRWIQSLWAGVERLVAELPEHSKVEIVRLEDPQMAKTMAEAVLAWVLYLHRDMPRYRRQQQERVWREHDLPLPSERTIGILGLGQLGRMSARVLLDQGFRACSHHVNSQPTALKKFRHSCGLNIWQTSPIAFQTSSKVLAPALLR